MGVRLSLQVLCALGGGEVCIIRENRVIQLDALSELHTVPYLNAIGITLLRFALWTTLPTLIPTGTSAYLMP